MKRHIIEVSDSLRIVVGPGIKKKGGRGKDAEWVEDDSKVRISTEYTSRSEPDTWKPGRGGIQFEPEHGADIVKALAAACGMDLPGSVKDVASGNFWQRQVDKATFQPGVTFKVSEDFEIRTEKKRKCVTLRAGTYKVTKIHCSTTLMGRKIKGPAVHVMVKPGKGKAISVCEKDLVEAQKACVSIVEPDEHRAGYNRHVKSIQKLGKKAAGKRKPTDIAGGDLLIGSEFCVDKDCKVRLYTYKRKAFTKGDVTVLEADEVWEVFQQKVIKNDDTYIGIGCVNRVNADEDEDVGTECWVKASTIARKVTKGHISWVEEDE